MDIAEVKQRAVENVLGILQFQKARGQPVDQVAAQRIWRILLEPEEPVHIEGSTFAFLSTIESLIDLYDYDEMVRQLARWRYDHDVAQDASFNDLSSSQNEQRPQERAEESIGSSAAHSLRGVTRSRPRPNDTAPITIGKRRARSLAMDQAAYEEATSHDGLDAVTRDARSTADQSAASSSSVPPAQAQDDGFDDESVSASFAPPGVLPRNPVPNQWQTWAALEDGVADLLETFSTRIRTVGMLGDEFKRSGSVFPGHSIWSPDPAKWQSQPDVLEHLRKLRIPNMPYSSPTAQPDLLLYCLGEFDVIDPQLKDRLLTLLPAQFHYVLTQVSGAGKTRMLFELLCLSWGFYFSSVWHASSNPYGSRDIDYAYTLIDEAKHMRPDHRPFHNFISDPGVLPNGDAVTAVRDLWHSNTKIAEHVFQTVLLARMLVYRSFRQIAADSELSLSEDEARRAWCILQVRPQLSGTYDVFLSMLHVLQFLGHSDLQKQLDAVHLDLEGKGWLPRIMVFDEAQHAATKWQTAFGPDAQAADAKTFFSGCRPVIKPLVASMHLILFDACIYISGTKLRLDHVQDALASAVFKNPTVRPVIDFGESTADSIDATLRHFFTDKLIDGLSRPILHDLTIWLQGRHRFLTTFIHAALLTGPTEEQMKHIMDTILYQAAGAETQPEGFRPLPSVMATKLVPNILQDPNQYPLDKRETLENIVVNFLLYSEAAKEKSNDISLLEYGIGRIHSIQYDASSTVAHKITVNENLILVALFGWANKRIGGRKLLQDRINHALMGYATSKGKGEGLENGLEYLLWEWFAGGGQILSDVFKFLSKPPPWANARARLIKTFAFQSPLGVTEIVQKSSTTSLGFRAPSGRASMGWFFDPVDNTDKHARSLWVRPPLLMPDQSFGPDAIAGLQLDPTGIPDTGLTGPVELILALQCKNKERAHDSVSLEKIIWRLSPDGWFRKGEALVGIAKDYKRLKGMFDPDSLPVPTPDPGQPSAEATKDGGVVYGNKLEWPVLRVLASFEGDAKMPNTKSAAVGVYPLAVLSDNAFNMGSLTFAGFKLAASRKQEREDTRVFGKLKHKEAIAKKDKRVKPSKSKKLTLEGLFKEQFINEHVPPSKPMYREFVRRWNIFITDPKQQQPLIDELKRRCDLAPNGRKTVQILQDSTQDDDDGQEDGSDMDED